jgi:hypothetical protein
MRKLSSKSLVAQVLMVFVLLSFSAFGGPSNTSTKSKQTKPRVAKKLDTRKVAAKSVKTGKLEVDEAQLLLDSGISRLSKSLECS